MRKIALFVSLIAAGAVMGACDKTTDPVEQGQVIVVNMPASANQSVGFEQRYIASMTLDGCIMSPYYQIYLPLNYTDLVPGKYSGLTPAQIKSIKVNGLKVEIVTPNENLTTQYSIGVLGDLTNAFQGFTGTFSSILTKENMNTLSRTMERALIHSCELQEVAYVAIRTPLDVTMDPLIRIKLTWTNIEITLQN